MTKNCQFSTFYERVCEGGGEGDSYLCKFNANESNNASARTKKSICSYNVFQNFKLKFKKLISAFKAYSSLFFPVLFKE